MTPEVKERITDVVREEFLTESIWLRRLVLRELQAISSENSVPRQCGNGATPVRGQCSKRSEPISSLYIRMRKEDRLLLHERAAARGMASATYASVLVRAHLRSLAPLPKDELIALKQAVSELSAVGRNLNQIARAANQGERVSGPGRENLNAMIRVCEGLRDRMRDLLSANLRSWEEGHAQQGQ